MKTKRLHLLSFAAVLVGALSLASCEQSPSVLTVGAILPQTGPGAQFADYIQKGLDLAASEINAGASDRIRIVYGDSRNDPSEGVSVFRQMVLRDGPPVIITALSSVTNAVAGLAEENNTVVVGTAVALPGVADVSDFVFRVYPEAEGLAGIIGAYAAEHCSDASVAYINDDFGRSAAQVFERTLVAAGDRLLDEEPYALTESDFRTQWQRMLASQDAPDCVWVVGYGPAYANLVRQFREAAGGLPVRLFGDMTLGLPVTRENVGAEGLEGVVYVDAPLDSTFVRRYRARYDEVPTSYAGYAYDILMMVDSVARARGTGSDQIRAGLASLRGYPGVMGPISIAPNGDAELSFQLMEIVEGEPRPLEAGR